MKKHPFYDCGAQFTRKKEELLRQGHALKSFRKEARLTQEDLAERIDISVRHLSDIENGKTDPSLTISRRWLHVTGLDAASPNKVTSFMLM